MEDVKQETLLSNHVPEQNSEVETGKESTAEDEIQVEKNPKKGKNRKRKKALHTAIRNQMEFYFSDANLSKDRFMQNAIKEGPEIPLEIFMNFNKLRTLTEDSKEIIKALNFSTVLKLNEDETKVSRLTPFRPKSQEEVDLCTIYVEHIPPHATIEWITSVFSEFGAVAYVSLPKFKDGFRIKGFAFVEFCDSESAFKAVKAYAASNAYAVLMEDPGQLRSIQAFNAENHEEKKAKSKTGSPKQQTGDGEPTTKKLKLDGELIKAENNLVPDKLDENPIKREEEIPSDKNQKPTPKKRKHILNFKEEMVLEAQTLSLQVMSKKEWKKLRNKYLDMQRKCLRQIRLNSRRPAYNESRSDPIVDIKEHSIPEVKPDEPSSADFQPGLIVKIALDEPISDAKRFKSQVKCQEGVTYVEAQDCCTVAFVRCIDAETAKSLVEKKIWSQSEILQGEEENDYWRKIEENRLKKREKTSRPKKSGAERARQKKETIIDADQPGYPTRAAQHKNLHIRFDDSNDQDDK